MQYRVEATRVRYGALTIRGAHAASFEILTEPWAKDRARVYFEGRSVEKALHGSFRALGAACGADAKRIFLGYAGFTYAHSYKAGDGFVLKSARAVEKHRQHFVVSKHVWLADTLLTRLPLEAASFEALGQGYARDRSQIVWCGELRRSGDRSVKVLKDADLSSFCVDASGAHDGRGRFLHGQRDAERLPVELETNVGAAGERLIEQLWREALISWFTDFDRSIVTDDGIVRVGKPPEVPTPIPSHCLRVDGPKLTLEAGERNATGSASSLELLAGWLYGVARNKIVGERVCVRVMLRTDGELVTETGEPPRWQRCLDLAYLFEKLGHRQEAALLLQRVLRWKPARDGSSTHDNAELRASKLLGALLAEAPEELIPRGTTTQAAAAWLAENAVFRSPDALVRRDVASSIGALTMATRGDPGRLARLAEPLLVLLDDAEPAVRAEAFASFDFLCSQALNGKAYADALVHADALAARNINLDMQSARRWACLTALGRHAEADEAWQLCLELMAGDPPRERTVPRAHTSIQAWRAVRERELAGAGFVP